MKIYNAHLLVAPPSAIDLDTRKQANDTAASILREQLGGLPVISGHLACFHLAQAAEDLDTLAADPLVYQHQPQLPDMLTQTARILRNFSVDFLANLILHSDTLKPSPEAHP